MTVTIFFRGIELEVEFDKEYAEPDVGLAEWVESYKVFYGECDVSEIVTAMDLWSEINELVYERIA